MKIFNLLILLVVYFWILWGLFVLVMGMMRARLDKRLNTISYVLGAPFIILGIFMDFIANIFASFVFLEFPKEWMISSRLKRHNERANGWRSKVSNYICTNILDIFDPSGDHC